MKKILLLLCIWVMVVTGCDSTPGKAVVYYRNGIWKNKQHEYMGAIAAFTSAINIYPKYTNAYYERAKTRTLLVTTVSQNYAL